MAAEDDGPNFSYAFGDAPSWNPAFRPDHESPQKSTFDRAEVERIPSGSLEQAQDDDELPEHGHAVQSGIGPPSWTEKPHLADQIPASDDDFFDRYGHPEPAPVAPSAEMDDGTEVWSGQDEERRPVRGAGDQSLTKVNGSRHEVQDHFGQVYEHQGEVTSLEEARQESVEAPLMAPESAPAEEWGASEDWQIGEEAAPIHIQAAEPITDAFDFEPEDPATREPQQPDNSTAMFSMDESVPPTEDAQLAADTTHFDTPTLSTKETPSLPKQVAEDKAQDEWGESGEDPFAFVAPSATDVLSGSIPDQAPIEESSAAAPPTGDLADMWSAVLGDDDILLDSDATAAFGFDDGEGFLAEMPVQPSSATSTQPPSHSRSLSSSKYTPADAQRPVPIPARSSSYLPEGPQFTDLSAPPVQAPAASRGPAPTPYQAAYQQPVQRPAMAPSAESFADKAKGGYHSPFDLPEDISVKRRRPVHHPHAISPTIQQLAAPPPRLSSMKSMPAMGTKPLTPTTPSFPGAGPPTPYAQKSVSAAYGVPPAAAPVEAKPPSRDGGFFADLPMAPKPHRHPTPSGRYSAQPTNQPPVLAPPATIRAASTSTISHPPPNMPTTVSHLRSPEKMPLYSEDFQSHSPRSNSIPPPSSRYSPAIAPGPAKSTYSPAPPPSGNASRYSPAPTAKPPPNLPTRHLSDGVAGPPRAQTQLYAPRTSSPLAAHHSTPNHEQLPAMSPPHGSYHQDTHGPRTRASMDRIGSIASLETVNENEGPTFSPPSRPEGPRQPPPPSSRTSTPPPPPRSNPSSGVSSPRKRASYAPTTYQSMVSECGIVPPRRSQTSSPGGAMKLPHISMANLDRPASVAALQSPVVPSNIPQPNRMISSLQGPAYHDMPNLIHPQDSSAQDPLQRWKGAPIFHWGNGNHVITTFPAYAPLYGGSQMGPMIRPINGEVRSRNLGELCPQSEIFLKFPGPLKKGKKKDVLAWLKSSVESMEAEHNRASMNGEFTMATHQRGEERLLLWKVMCLLVEYDGLLEGTPAVEDAVRKLITPALPGNTPFEGTETSPTNTMPEAFDPSAVKALRRHLYAGEREKAVWHAVDQRLWAHALLVASTMNDKEIWKQVVQEFVRKEVRKTGDNTEALAALYQVFAGNWEESIDELVSVSARSGFQMVSTAGSGTTQKDALAGLDKWRETVTLILNNRSVGDAAALTSLGNLLSGYGRLEAGHICFLFARSNAKFGGADDQQSHFTLLGGSAALQGSDFGNSLDTILLSEVYEFALSMATPTSPPVPHLQSYKMYHAEVLAEAGRRTEAQQYCDAVTTIITSKANRSAYYNSHLLSWLDDFARRLSQAPADKSDSSWKPSIDKVSSSIWGKFNNFIAGDHAETTDTTPPPTGDQAQYMRLPSDTPPITRSVSAMDMYPSYQSNGTAVPTAPSNSRYAPSNVYAPRSSSEAQRPKYDAHAQSAYQPRTSMESTRSGYEPRLSAEYGGFSASPQRIGAPSSSHSASSQYAAQAQHPLAPPTTYSPEGPGYHPSNSPYMPSPLHNAQPEVNNPSPAYLPTPPSEAQQPVNGYTPLAKPESVAFQEEPNTESYGYEPPTSGYEPPTSEYDHQSSSYEPPSYQPYQPDDEPAETTNNEAEENKPKKKSFMDDDDDDAELAARAAALKKQQKSEADRAADEAFRKAAEADAAKDSGPPSGARGSWFGGWFGKKDSKDLGQQQSGPVKAKLGEENSFYFDKELNKWVNKKGGAAAATPNAPTPPPPRSSAPPSRSSSGAPPPPSSHPAPFGSPLKSGSPAPPISSGSMGLPAPLVRNASTPQAGPVAAIAGSGPPSRPPSRPSTSMSNASDIDDLLGPAMPRRAAGAKKGTRKGRYVDVMANKS